MSESRTIGVDIDGVMNYHREHFCKVLECKTGKVVRPQDITTIPVHKNSSLGVKREDEIAVFNEPCYWIDMPVIEEARDVLEKLRTELK